MGEEMMEKCRECGVMESDKAILFSVICCDCYGNLPFEFRRKILEEAAKADAIKTALLLDNK